MPVLKAVRGWLWDRRRGLLTAAGFFGGFYLMAQYIWGRLEEMRDKVIQDRAARENLRKRFQQNQEDCSYHILALLPTLGNSILEEMDVERITLQLQQSRTTTSQAKNSPLSAAHLQPEGPSRGLSDSVISEPTSTAASDLTDDGPHPPHSRPQSSSSAPHVNPSSHFQPPPPGASATSHAGPSFDTSGMQSSSAGLDWVTEFRAQQAQLARSLALTGAVDGSPTSSHETGFSDSGVSGGYVTEGTESEISIEGSVAESGVLVDASSVITRQSAAPELITFQPPSPEIHKHVPLTSKEKTELWREMKVLAFSRALTIIYTTTLLALLTHIQLNLIGTRKYVESVRQLAREARQAEEVTANFSIGGLFFGDGPGEDEDEEEPGRWEGGIDELESLTEETERKFLTMSWWLLNVGWRDVGERVREAVENVFQSVSLKANLGPQDVERLISEVRKRVEFENESDGADISAEARRVNFLRALLPPSSHSDHETEFVLLQGGLSSHDAYIDPMLRALLDETSAFASSADFGVVLGVAIERGVEALMRNLRENVYGMGSHEGGGDYDESGRGVEERAEKVRLAAILPGVSRWAHLAVNGIPNELVEVSGERMVLFPLSGLF
ncbi:Peroxin-3 [Cantharellus anzutake]|uniref:Peroxin-3 n=1 Tax=Cantharellus anzutake TaxID=1750568 RepID=UPI001906C3F4|nr:Peroxin-3 [Cantharellus anzutake]KAF8336873.1 Peroxin-3 [Cantharellus anzutake]